MWLGCLVGFCVCLGLEFVVRVLGIGESVGFFFSIYWVYRFVLSVYCVLGLVLGVGLWRILNRCD